MTAGDDTAQVPLSIAQDAIAELHSAYSLGTLGPSKRISGVALENRRDDAERGKAMAELVVSSTGEGMHDDTWNQQRKFTVTAGDLKAIFFGAQNYKTELARLSVELWEAQEVLDKARDAWYDAGMPLAAQVTLRQPLKFKVRR